MSYQGWGNSYSSVDTVDDVADYTDMQGEASAMNAAAANKGSWSQSPTKSMVALWFFLVLLYFLLVFFFRGNLA